MQLIDESPQPRRARADAFCEHSLKRCSGTKEQLRKHCAEQLDVWEAMGAKYDPTHPYAKQRAVHTLQEQRASGAGIEKEELAEANANAEGEKVRNSDLKRLFSF